jgi:hypothetical protein
MVFQADDWCKRHDPQTLEAADPPATKPRVAYRLLGRADDLEGLERESPGAPWV